MDTFLLRKRQGVPQDYVAGHTFFTPAAANGHEDAPKLRDELAKEMTAEQVAEVQRREPASGRRNVVLMGNGSSTAGRSRTR